MYNNTSRIVKAFWVIFVASLIGWFAWPSQESPVIEETIYTHSGPGVWTDTSASVCAEHAPYNGKYWIVGKAVFHVFVIDTHRTLVPDKMSEYGRFNAAVSTEPVNGIVAVFLDDYISERNAWARGVSMSKNDKPINSGSHLHFVDESVKGFESAFVPGAYVEFEADLIGFPFGWSSALYENQRDPSGGEKCFGLCVTKIKKAA